MSHEPLELRATAQRNWQSWELSSQRGVPRTPFAVRNTDIADPLNQPFMVMPTRPRPKAATVSGEGRASRGLIWATEVRIRQPVV